MTTCPYCKRPVKLPPALQGVDLSTFAGGRVRTTCCNKLVTPSIELVLRPAEASGGRIIIAGSRDMPFEDYPKIGEAVTKSGYQITEVVSGKASRGADLFGEKWAYEQGLPRKLFPADWDAFGKSAGFIRNAQMAEYADGLIVFIYNNSAGSTDMLRRMQLLRKPTFAIYDGNIDYAF